MGSDPQFSQKLLPGFEVQDPGALDGQTQSQPKHMNPLVEKHAQRIGEIREEVWRLQRRETQVSALETRVREYASSRYTSSPESLATLNRFFDHIFNGADLVGKSFRAPQQIEALLASTPCLFTFYPGIGTHESLPLSSIVLTDRFSWIQSRGEIRLESQLTADPRTTISSPMTVANMRSSIGEDLARVMIDEGLIPIFHRFKRPLNPDDVHSETPTAQTQQQADAEKLHWAEQFGDRSFFSCGVRPESVDFTKTLIRQGILGVCVDIALGNSAQAAATVLELREFINEGGYNTQIMAGNIDSDEGYLTLALAGADIIKVGIGPGSPCTTRLVTRAGSGQGSALMNVARAKFVLGAELAKAGKVAPNFLADGGIEGGADVLVALALQASGVMVGKMAARTIESGALKKTEDGQQLAYYFGEASRTARLLEDGTVNPNYSVEGMGKWIPCEGSFRDVLRKVKGELRNAFTYYNANNVVSLQGKFSIEQQLCDLVLGQHTGLYIAAAGHAQESGTRLK